MYLKHHAYLFNIHSTKHDEETEIQNKLHMLFSEEVAPPYQLPISGFKLHIYTWVTQRKPCVHHMYPNYQYLRCNKEETPPIGYLSFPTAFVVIITSSACF